MSAVQELVQLCVNFRALQQEEIDANQKSHRMLKILGEMKNIQISTLTDKVYYSYFAADIYGNLALLCSNEAAAEKSYKQVLNAYDFLIAILNDPLLVQELDFNQLAQFNTYNIEDPEKALEVFEQTYNEPAYEQDEYSNQLITPF